MVVYADDLESHRGEGKYATASEAEFLTELAQKIHDAKNQAGPVILEIYKNSTRQRFQYNPDTNELVSVKIHLGVPVRSSDGRKILRDYFDQAGPGVLKIERAKSIIATLAEVGIEPDVQSGSSISKAESALRALDAL